MVAGTIENCSSNTETTSTASPVISPIQSIELKEPSQSLSSDSPSTISNTAEDTSDKVQIDCENVKVADQEATSLSVDDENSNSSGIGSMSKNDDDNMSTENDENELSLLPSDVIEEERKFRLQTEQEISERARSRVVLADEEKAKRYKHLMTLLGKSSQYALYMSQKLKKEKELNAPAVVKEENDTLKEMSQNTVGKASRRPSKRKQTVTNPSKKIRNNNSESVIVNSDVPEGHYRNKSGFIVSNRQPKLLSGGIMRDYQLDGLEWVVTLYRNAVNGILADEMGLGKTIQMIALICHLREKGIFGPHVIIAPLSTLPNWISEFALFSPEVPVMLFHGDENKRNKLKREFANLVKNKERTKIPVILTSYEMPLRDKKFFSTIEWCYCIVDEGHRLKNYQSMLAVELRRYKVESRLLLTGTPLQNNLTELWSLLNYLIPEIFDDLPMFESLFDFSDLDDEQKQNELIEKEKEEQIISKMHKILEPFLLRRLKSDVKIELPRKKEVLVYAPLTAPQEEIYTATMDKTINMEANKKEPDIIVDGKVKRRCTQKQFCYNDSWSYDEFEDFLRGRAATENIIVEPNGKHFYFNLKMQNPTMQLRKIANHSYLVKCPIVPGTREMIITEDIIAHSGKLLVLEALLPRLKAAGHKVLLFSTFTSMLDLIEDYVMMRGHKFVRLDGRYQIHTRLESIKQFNSDPETFIFLISTRAGGLGINLTAADTVIIFDSDWNPQVDLQAQDRCHRIGQTKPVIVYRLVTSGTIDQHIVDVAHGKRKLEKLVVKRDKFKQKDDKEPFNINELRELLSSTDHKHVIHPNGLVLSEEQIENLLDRSDLID